MPLYDHNLPDDASLHHLRMQGAELSQIPHHPGMQPCSLRDAVGVTVSTGRQTANSPPTAAGQAVEVDDADSLPPPEEVRGISIFAPVQVYCIQEPLKSEK